MRGSSSHSCDRRSYGARKIRGVLVIVLGSTAMLFARKTASPPAEENFWPTKHWAPARPDSVGLALLGGVCRGLPSAVGRCTRVRGRSTNRLLGQFFPFNCPINCSKFSIVTRSVSFPCRVVCVGTASKELLCAKTIPAHSNAAMAAVVTVLFISYPLLALWRSGFSRRGPEGLSHGFSRAAILLRLMIRKFQVRTGPDLVPVRPNG